MQSILKWHIIIDIKRSHCGFCYYLCVGGLNIYFNDNIIMSVYSPSTSDFNTPSPSSSVPFQTYKGISKVHQLNAFQGVYMACHCRSTTTSICLQWSVSIELLSPNINILHPNMHSNWIPKMCSVRYCIQMKSHDEFQICTLRWVVDKFG